ncbi:MAG: hypothetical protein ACPGSB_02340 [Opitutales bacterium]
MSTGLQGFEPEIKLTGPKGLVLSADKRQTVLKLGNKYLNEKPDDFLQQIDEVKDPFGFKEASPVEPAATGNAVAEEPDPVIIYDDAAVLEASAANFSKQVRGSIVRGDASFLQLEGGVLLRPGTSFPVRLPQAQGQTFTMTLVEISSNGYSLRIGEATKRLTFDVLSSSSSSSPQLSNP